MKKLVFAIITILPAIVFSQVKPAKIVIVVSSYGKDMGKCIGNSVLWKDNPVNSLPFLPSKYLVSLSETG